MNFMFSSFSFVIVLVACIDFVFMLVVVEFLFLCFVMFYINHNEQQICINKSCILFFIPLHFIAAVDGSSSNVEGAQSGGDKEEENSNIPA